MTADSCVGCDAQVLCVRFKQVNNLGLSAWLVADVSEEPVLHASLIMQALRQIQKRNKLCLATCQAAAGFASTSCWHHLSQESSQPPARQIWQRSCM